MRGSFKFHKCHSHFLLAVMVQNAFYLFYIQITFRFIDGALFHDKGAVAQGVLVGEKIPLPSGDIGVFAFSIVPVMESISQISALFFVAACKMRKASMPLSIMQRNSMPLS